MPTAIDLLLRSEKGSQLRKNDVDANFTTLQNAFNALKTMADYDKATAAQLVDWIASTGYGITTDIVRAALEWETVTYAASFAPDWSTNYFNMRMTLPGNLTLANPTNVNAMSFKQIYLVGDSATQRTLSFGANFKGDLPTLTDITSTKGYLIGLQPLSSTHIIVTAVRAL